MSIPATASSAISAHDAEEFAAFYKEHMPRLQRYAVMRFGRGLAEEIGQLTMERALQNFGALDRVRDPWPWLRVVARNVGLNLQRHEGRCSPCEDMVGLAGQASRWSDPVDAAECAERRVLMNTALGRLSDGQQRVLMLRLQEELPVEGIAELLGTTENAVRQQLFKARRSFMVAYAALGGRALAAGAFALLSRSVRGLFLRRPPRGGIVMTATFTTLVSAAGFGVVLQLQAPVSPAMHEALQPIRPTAAFEHTSFEAHLSKPASTAGPTNAGTLQAQVPTGRSVRTKVSKHPLKQGEVASITVSIPTPIGTVYYRDSTVNGESGPVCSQQPTLCS